MASKERGENKNGAGGERGSLEKFLERKKEEGEVREELFRKLRQEMLDWIKRMKEEIKYQWKNIKELLEVVKGQWRSMREGDVGGG